MSTASATLPSTPTTGQVTAPAAGVHRFAPVSRARGYHPVGGALVASAADAAGPVRLTVGLNRVVVAQVTYRASQAPFEVDVAAPGEVTRVLTAVAEHAELTGRCEVSLRAPWPRDSGIDVAAASAFAALAGLLEAAELPATPALRAAAVRGLGGATPVPLEEGFGVFSTDRGTWVRQFEDAPRFHVQLWHVPGSGSENERAVGTVPAGPIPVDLVEAGRWLSEANGAPVGTLGALAAELAAEDPDVFGVVGGHEEGSSVGLLLSPDAALAGPAAYRLRHVVESRLGKLAPFVATFTSQSRTR